MPLACVGLNHHTAPLAFRERFAFGPHRRRELLLTLRSEGHLLSRGISEMALLSTCNRTELYGIARDPLQPVDVPTALAELLVSGAGESLDQVRPHLYMHRGTPALAHLCKVAAGLDSLIIGETEILGQVAEARREASECGTGGPFLDAAFRTAIDAGRRARCDTAIGRRSASIASEAIRMIGDLVRSLPEVRFTVVGSGQLARLVTRILVDSGASRILVVGRSLEHASTACDGTTATPQAWQHLPAALRDADVVVCTTGAPHAVITRDLLSETRGDASRAMLVVDLAVPRDADPAVAMLPGVTLIDLDTIQAQVEANLEARAAEVPRVERIVADAMAEYQAWLRGEELRPALAALRHRAEAIRQQEIQRARWRLGDTDHEGHRLLEEFSRGLVTKLLDAPSRRLRSETDTARQAALAEALQVLFDLEPLDAPGKMS